MPRIPALLLALTLLTSQAHADDASDIADVITKQIEAFQHDDAQAAFAYASPDIQAMFGTPGYFMGMVANGYPPVYRPRHIAFGPLLTVEGTQIQKVELIGPDGSAWTALYTMEKQPDGSWKIAACRLVESKGAGA